jgi:acetyl-CoA carboxylase carboxyltransferase component
MTAFPASGNMPHVPDQKPRSGNQERPDLGELIERRALTRDEARADAVDRRRASGARTARENIADLIDPDSLIEYGRFAIAAQRGRREVEDLIANTPADGLVAGTARINGELFGERSACAVLSYDSPAPREPSAIARRTASSS